MNWAIIFFNAKVKKTTEAMPAKLLARFLFLTDRMKEMGPHLGMPHTRALGEGLFELRVKAEEGIARIFYCTQIKNQIVIVHSFIKKSQKIPKKELAIAYQRLKEVKHD